MICSLDQLAIYKFVLNCLSIEYLSYGCYLYDGRNLYQGTLNKALEKMTLKYIKNAFFLYPNVILKTTNSYKETRIACNTYLIHTYKGT